MSIYLDWDNTEQSVLRFTFVAPWTWNEFYTVQEQCATLCSGVDYVVDAIVDVTAGKDLPSNALTHLNKVAGKIPPGQGILVGIGVDAFLKSMVDMVISRHPHLANKLYPVKTEQEAYAVIANAQLTRKRVG